MYHSSIVSQRLARVVDEIRKGGDPGFDPQPTPLEECWDRCEEMAGYWDPDQGITKMPTMAQERWIIGELTLSKVDFRYWMARYARVKTKEATLEPIKLWESQEIILNKLGEVEKDAVSGVRGDGVNIAVLKARQLGASTLTEALIGHRGFFYGNLMAIIAGDTPDQSAYLFDMIERIYEHLPWWMKPELTYHVKDSQMYFGKTDSLISVYAAKSIRGGNDLELGKGTLGRGKTPHLAHLSELSTWSNPEQLDDSFFPAFPRTPSTLGILESTARGRGNWWHDTWVLAKRGLGRVVPVFIPWYAETATYRRPAPLDWAPSADALMHASKAMQVSAYWCGKTIILDRDQLYWWETTKAEYKEKKKLNIFLAEYAADDMECFQNTTVSVFPTEMMHDMRLKAKELSGLLEVQHRTEMVSHV
jgi:hypothetical protein